MLIKYIRGDSLGLLIRSTLIDSTNSVTALCEQCDTRRIWFANSNSQTIRGKTISTTISTTISLIESCHPRRPVGPQLLFGPLCCAVCDHTAGGSDLKATPGRQRIGGPSISFFPFSSLAISSPFPPSHRQFPPLYHSPQSSHLSCPLPLIRLEGLGSAVCSSNWCGRSPATKRILVHLDFRGKNVGGQISCIF